jgi:AmmeMemoRadiSam system protein B
MTSAVRTPAVAGRFYPDRAEELLRDIRHYTSPGKRQADAGRIAAIGCVAPHAGYIYSGSIAGAVYSRLRIPQRCVILCPNHTGKGRPLAVMANTTWQTPLGEVAADRGDGRAVAAPLSGARRGQRGAPRRTRHRSPASFPAGAAAGIEIVPIVGRHQRL